MNADRTEIFRVAQALQVQSDVPTWMLGSSSTVFAIASGEPEVFGRKGRWFLKLFGALGISALTRHVLSLLAMVVVTYWWLRCLRTTRGSFECGTLFVGFGSGIERRMLEELRAEVGKTIRYVDERDPCSLAQVARPKLRVLLKTCRREAFRVVDSLSKAREPLIQAHQRRWLVSSAIRLSGYVFAVAWADAIPSGIERIVFVTSGPLAFAVATACSAERRHVELRQHGLHRISIIFPPFRSVRAVNRYEANHIRQRLPQAKVTVSQIGRNSTTTRGNAILIVSANDTDRFRKASHISILQSICDWATERNWDVWVRRHPSEPPTFWAEAFPHLLRDESPSLIAALTNIRPQFVVGWGSTALVEALQNDVIPVLIRSGSDWLTRDLVFPLLESTMVWESGLEPLNALVVTPQAYQRRLEELQQTALVGPWST